MKLRVEYFPATKRGLRHHPTTTTICWLDVVMEVEYFPATKRGLRPLPSQVHSLAYLFQSRGILPRY